MRGRPKNIVTCLVYDSNPRCPCSSSIKVSKIGSGGSITHLISLQFHASVLHLQAYSIVLFCSLWMWRTSTSHCWCVHLLYSSTRFLSDPPMLFVPLMYYRAFATICLNHHFFMSLVPSDLKAFHNPPLFSFNCISTTNVVVEPSPKIW